MVYVIALYNFLNQQQAILPDHYPDLNSCKVAMIEKHYAVFNPIGVHGKCILAVSIKHRYHRPLHSMG